MLKRVSNPNPTPAEIEQAVRSAEGLQVEFQYEIQHPRPQTPSRLAANEDTAYGVPFNIIRGRLSAREGETFYRSENGVSFLMYPKTRVKAQPRGEGYWSRCNFTREFRQGQRLPRRFLINGVRLGTLRVKPRGGKYRVRLFPEVPVA